MINQLLYCSKQLLFPPFCPVCYCFIEREQEVFCARCAESIDPLMSLRFSLTPARTMDVFAVGAYRDPLKQLVIAKYYSAPAASVQMGYLIARIAGLSSLHFDYIVPIPLHWTRYAWRSFNQSDIIAHTLSGIYQVPVLHALKRSTRTRYQTTLNAQERLDNLSNAFTLTKKSVLLQDKSVLLVDDLFTTGATAAAAAKQLYKARVAQVTCAVACRAL